MSKNKKKGGFMSGLSSFGKSALDKANSAVKEVKNFVTNPKHNFHEGNILGLISTTTDKCLMLPAGGMLMCGNYQKQYKNDRFCQFEVMSGGSVHPQSIKLRCVANRLYLGLYNGIIAGSTAGGPECDFLVHAVNNEQGSSKWVGLECAIAPGYHIGVLPTGQLGSPAYTTLENTASHFSVECVQRKEMTAEHSHYAEAPPPPCDSSNLSISCGGPPDVHYSLSPCHTTVINPASSCGSGHASVTMTIPGAPVIVGNTGTPAVVLAAPVVTTATAGPPLPVMTAGNPYPPPAAPVAGNPYPPPAAPVAGNPYPPPAAPGAGNPYPPPAAPYPSY